ncbi:hypothetical protein YC2023_001762 [Brassica napus]
MGSFFYVEATRLSHCHWKINILVSLRTKEQHMVTHDIHDEDTTHSPDDLIWDDKIEDDTVVKLV